MKRNSILEFPFFFNLDDYPKSVFVCQKRKENNKIRISGSNFVERRSGEKEIEELKKKRFFLSFKTKL